MESDRTDSLFGEEGPDDAGVLGHGEEVVGKGKSNDPVACKRIELSARALGFLAPPVGVLLRPQDLKPDGWSVIAFTWPGKTFMVAQWLSHWEPKNVEHGEGLTPKSLRATFNRMADPWREVLQGPCVDHLVFTPQGTLSLMVKDEPSKVHGFVESLKAGSGVVQSPRVRDYQGDMKTERVLTPRQLEAMVFAVAYGYYDMPRRMGLRVLADRMGLSLGAMAELMRRGESQLAQAHVDSITARCGNDRQGMYT